MAADIRPAVCAARSVLSSLSATLEQRDLEGHRPSHPAPMASAVLGSWSASQDGVLDVIAAADAIRVNTAMVPQSLRGFLA